MSPDMLDLIENVLKHGFYSVSGALKDSGTPDHLKSKVLSICLAAEFVEAYVEQAKENKDEAFECAKTEVNQAFKVIMDTLNKAHFGENHSNDARI